MTGDGRDEVRISPRVESQGEAVAPQGEPMARQDDLTALIVGTQDELDEMEAQPKYGIAFFVLGSMTMLFSLFMVLMVLVAAVLTVVAREMDLVLPLGFFVVTTAVFGAMSLGMFRYHRGLLEKRRALEHRLDRLLAADPDGVVAGESHELEPMSFRQYVRRNIDRIRSRFGGGDWVDDLVTYGPGAAAGAFLSLMYPDDIVWIMAGVAVMSLVVAGVRKWWRNRWEEEAPSSIPRDDG